MISKLYNMVAIISIATLLALAGFSAFLFGSGRVTAERLDTMAAVLRGEFDELAEDAEPATGTDQTQPRGRRRAAAEEVRAAQQVDQLRYQMLERARRDVDARQALLDQALQHVINEQETLVTQRTDLTQKQRALTDEALDVGAKRELDLLAELPPKQAKDHIIRVWNNSPAAATRLLLALDDRKAARVLKEMKTPDEQLVMSQLLEQLRTQELPGATATSGTTAGAAAP